MAPPVPHRRRPSAMVLHASSESASLAFRRSESICRISASSGSLFRKYSGSSKRTRCAAEVASSCNDWRQTVAARICWKSGPSPPGG
eukprot:136869-Alexandrium_andersonii.AAC.1